MHQRVCGNSHHNWCSSLYPALARLTLFNFERGPYETWLKIPTLKVDVKRFICGMVKFNHSLLRLHPTSCPSGWTITKVSTVEDLSYQKDAMRMNLQHKGLKPLVFILSERDLAVKKRVSLAGKITWMKRYMQMYRIMSYGNIYIL